MTTAQTASDKRQPDTYSKELGKHKERESLDGRQEWK